MGVSSFRLVALRNRLTGEGLLDLAGVLILCGPFLFWDLSRALYLLTALFAAGYVIRQRIRLPREQLYFSLPILGFVAVAALSWLANGMSDSGWNFLTSRYCLLLFAIPLVSLFCNQYRSLRNPWRKYQLAAMTLGGVSFYEILVLGQSRAEGADNAVIFGFAAAMITSVVIAAYDREREYRIGLAIYFGSLAAGVAAVLLSGTRGSWIALGASFAIAGYFYSQGQSLARRLTYLILGIVLLAGIGLAVPQIKYRIVNMVEIVAPYLGDDDDIAFSSVRYRIESWKAGWHIGREHLAWGAGSGNYRSELEAYVAANPRLEGLQSIRHTHNQYMQVFATLGLPGLAVFVALLCAHFVLFARYLMRRYSREVRGFALAGVMLVTVYALLSLTGVPLDRKKNIIIYGFCSASLWGCLLGALAQHRAAKAPAHPDQVFADR